MALEIREIQQDNDKLHVLTSSYERVILCFPEVKNRRAIKPPYYSSITSSNSAVAYPTHASLQSRKSNQR